MVEPVQAKRLLFPTAARMTGMPALSAGMTVLNPMVVDAGLGG
jgi:hypothetical protein